MTSANDWLPRSELRLATVFSYRYPQRVQVWLSSTFR